jgi:hypothetical protein
MAWERALRGARRRIDFDVVAPNGTVWKFPLGAHRPALRREDEELIHRLWLTAARQSGGNEIHHRDIVVAGLCLLEQELAGPGRERALALIKGQAVRQELPSEAPSGCSCDVC